MSNFSSFKTAVEAQFKAMSANTLFLSSVNKDALWETYLSSFPEGSNPIYKERTEHDCNCCKQFIRQAGGVVTIQDNQLVSVWDVTVEAPYQEVANALAALVKQHAIDTIFLHDQPSVGTDHNFSLSEDGTSIRWEHFYTKLPSAVVVNTDRIGSLQGSAKTNVQVFQRGLTEVTMEAIETVLDLIAQNSLYRGEEHSAVVTEVKKLKRDFDKASDKELFCWVASQKAKHIAGFRNTVIGTLLMDLSEGKDLEFAVKSFETKVAPSNYKRPTALITEAMKKSAVKTIKELGIESALSRRYAVVSDLTINNVLFADRSVQPEMGVLDVLDSKIKTTLPNLDKVEKISIESFIEKVLPTASSIEVLVSNKHVPNLVSLIAPVDATAPNILKWGNNFSWSYIGEITDSDMRQAVQAKGGRVDGVFRFTHQWNYSKRNASLMDLHVFLPAHKSSNHKDGCHDNYGNLERVGWNHRKHMSTQGVQDVDYTDRAPEGYVPVENITFPSLSNMPEGTYTCKIHNWSLRAPTEGGFKAEIEVGGEIYSYELDRPLKHKEWVTVAEVTLKNGVFTVDSKLPLMEETPKQIWGITTTKFHKVNMVMYSPNHWDGEQTGNKHYMFMLNKCVNPESTRGLYNEFLTATLNEHRKVFEVLGSSLKTKPSEEQLSGLGFSSTQRNELIVRVKGTFNRLLAIHF